MATDRLINNTQGTEIINALTAITNAIGNIDVAGLHVDWSYTVLPATGNSNIIYAIPTGDTEDPYDFYAWNDSDQEFVQIDFKIDITIDSAMSSSSTNPVQNAVITTALADKVDVVSGKGLSANDFTDALKTKLDGIESGAQVNPTIDSALSDSSENAVQNKVVTAVMKSMFTVFDNAGCHNSLYRGVDLTTRSWCDVDSNGYITTTGINAICSRISDGTFDDLYIGDYFKIKMVSDFGTEDVYCVLADFDTYLTCGDTPLTAHHAVIVSRNCFVTTAKMNSTNTTGVSQNTDNPVGVSAASADQKGGYYGSDMRQLTLPKYSTALGNVFGTHLLTYRSILDNAMNPNATSAGYSGWTGASSNWEWVNSTVELMNEVQVFGTNVWQGSGYNTGIHKSQLNYFKHNPGAIQKTKSGSRYYWWLRSVCSSYYFAYVNDNGGASRNYASVSVGVSPFWLIG